jgi:hypothetical protein
LHDILDTEKTDLQGEVAWPQEFKKSLREGLSSHVSEKFHANKAFKLLHERFYRTAFVSYHDFVAAVSNLVVIGAENGADLVWAMMVDALEAGSVLPSHSPYARNLWPLPAPEELKMSWQRKISEEYLSDHVLGHVYEDHYKQSRQDFPAFVSLLAENLVNGVTNGAEDTLAAIYRCFMRGAPMPVGRRNPRMLRSW